MGNHSTQENRTRNDSEVEHSEDVIVKKPYIIIIGIAKYAEPCRPLPFVSGDVTKMKYLWSNKFKYDSNYMSIASEDIGEEIKRKELNNYLMKIRGKINTDKCPDCDGLIIIYSGHGATNNDIVCSDMKKLSVSKIEETFSSEQCFFLEGKPKILYFDSCRGDETMESDEIHQIKGENGKSARTRYINKLSDFYLHFATCQNYVSWGNSKGSYCINALYNVYTNNYEKHKTNSISLHETSIKINQMVNESNKGQQTCEIMSRLTYNVYIQPNEPSLNDKILSRADYDDALERKVMYEKEVENKDKQLRKMRQKQTALMMAQSNTEILQTIIKDKNKRMKEIEEMFEESKEANKKINNELIEWQLKFSKIVLTKQEIDESGRIFAFEGVSYSKRITKKCQEIKQYKGCVQVLNEEAIKLKNQLKQQQEENKQEIEKLSKIMQQKDDSIERLIKYITPIHDDEKQVVMQKQNDIQTRFDHLKKQYFTHIFDMIRNEITRQYEDDWEEDDLYGAMMIDGEGRKILFDLLHTAYRHVCVYKNDRSRQLIGGNIVKIFDEILTFLIIKERYCCYSFWENQSISKQFHTFIGKAYELCWIMLLNTPTIHFYPETFSIHNQNVVNLQYVKRT